MVRAQGVDPDERRLQRRAPRARASEQKELVADADEALWLCVRRDDHQAPARAWLEAAPLAPVSRGRSAAVVSTVPVAMSRGGTAWRPGALRLFDTWGRDAVLVGTADALLAVSRRTGEVERVLLDFAHDAARRVLHASEREQVAWVERHAVRGAGGGGGLEVFALANATIVGAYATGPERLSRVEAAADGELWASALSVAQDSHAVVAWRPERRELRAVLRCAYGTQLFLAAARDQVRETAAAAV